MKIVHINTYNTGGAAKACLRLHAALLNKNINSKVVLLYKTDDSIPEVYDFRDYNRGRLQFWIDKFRNRIRNDYDRIRLAFKSPSAKPFSSSSKLTSSWFSSAWCCGKYIDPSSAK